VRAALKNCGYDIPPTHITINLAPADIRKEGSGFDLPMALGILGVRGMLPVAIEARSGLNNRSTQEIAQAGSGSVKLTHYPT
jgi:predicted ATPase with chaperone activity